jgi:hypothetical protein
MAAVFAVWIAYSGAKTPQARFGAGACGGATKRAVSCPPLRSVW